MNLKNQKVYIETLGCPKNIVDSELLAQNFVKNGAYLKVDSPEDADIILINTCGFIDIAKEESINTILQYANDYKKSDIYVTGCLVTRYKDVLKRSIPEIKNFYTIDETYRTFLGTNNINDMAFQDRALLTPKSYAYVKISEGCNRKCSYCTIPYIKGEYRSRYQKNILEEIKHLRDRGVKELILVAQDLLSFGIDNNENLMDLLENIEKMDNIERVRLLYLYPDDRIVDIVKFISRSEKFCNYVEMPMQHISESILKNMNRPYRAKRYYRLIDDIRKYLPDAALRSTFIVGFPGESEEDFNKLKRFLEDVKFNWAGFYKYSDEEDTPANRLPGKLKEHHILERINELVEIQKKITSDWLFSRKGKEYNVIIDEIVEQENLAFGRSEFEAPEIDGNILLDANDLKVGDTIKTRIVESFDYDLKGEKI